MPAAGAGNIELPGSVDTYTFTGAAGQKVFVDQLAASSCSLTWSLTGPGDATVMDSRGICADPGQITLGAAGTYTLKVLATGSTTGTYSFRITDVAAPQSFAYTVGTTVVNGTPAAGAGNLESPGSVDTYTFNVVAGQKVFVDHRTAASCSMTWSLTGPSDTTVFDTQGICDDPGHFTLALAGTYTLRVAATGSVTGTYSFRITKVPAAQTFAYAVGNTVASGVPAAGAGNIEAPGSVDNYTFSAAAGQTVFVDQLSATSCSLVWSMTGPSGAVFDVQDICGDPGQFTLPDERYLHDQGDDPRQHHRHLQLPRHERRRPADLRLRAGQHGQQRHSGRRGGQRRAARLRSTATRSRPRRARRCSSISSARRAAR